MNFRERERERDILSKYFIAKLVRETYESHVDCGLHESSDRKYQ